VNFQAIIIQFMKLIIIRSKLILLLLWEWTHNYWRIYILYKRIIIRMNNLLNQWTPPRRAKQRALSPGTPVFSSLSHIILKTMLMWASMSCLVFLKGRWLRIYWLAMPRARFRFLIPNSDIVNLAPRNLELKMTSSLVLMVLEVVSLTNPPQMSTRRRCSS